MIKPSQLALWISIVCLTFCIQIVSFEGCLALMWEQKESSRQTLKGHNTIHMYVIEISEG